MNPAVEILVHISAPSRGSDDARYRTQALGFLAFEAATRHTVLSHEGRLQEKASDGGGTTGVGHPVAVLHPSELLSAAHNERGGRDAHLDQGSVIASQSPTRTETHDLPAPPIRPIEPPRHSRQVSASIPPNTHSPPTQSSSPRPPHLFPAPRIHIIQTSTVSGAATAPTASSNPHFNPLHRAQSDSWEAPPSVVPDSQPEIHSLKHNLGSDQAPPDSAQAKRQRWTPPTRGTSSTASDSHASAAPARHLPPSPPLHPPSPPIALSPARAPADCSASTTIQIHTPPPPPTATHALTTHITTSLAIIERELPLSKHFKPLHTSRPLRVLERGCWVVGLGRRESGDNAEGKQDGDAESGASKGGWDESLRTRFWEYMIRFVGEGRAGWGVWCERSTSATNISLHSGVAVGEARASEEVEADIVKVFCWGEVVGHVYLLLFLASERKVRGLGARWIDACGSVVVRMA